MKVAGEVDMFEGAREWVGGVTLAIWCPHIQGGFSSDSVNFSGDNLTDKPRGVSLS